MAELQSEWAIMCGTAVVECMNTLPQYTVLFKQRVQGVADTNAIRKAGVSHIFSPPKQVPNSDALKCFLKNLIAPEWAPEPSLMFLVPESS